MKDEERRSGGMGEKEGMEGKGSMLRCNLQECSHHIKDCVFFSAGNKNRKTFFYLLSNSQGNRKRFH